MAKKHLALFLTALLAFLVPVGAYEIIGVFLPSQSSLPQDRLDAQRAQVYASLQKSSIVLIGNSLLDEAVDVPLLSSKIGKNIVSLRSGGADSAWWYLSYKNLVVEAPNPPSHVYFFFRDYDLTRPTSRVLGPYGAALREISLNHEPLLEQLAYSQWSDRLRRVFERYCALYRDVPKFRKSSNATLKRYAADLLRVSASTPDRAIKDVFRDDRMDPALLTQRQIQTSAPTEESVHLPFERQVNQSFLPALIALSKPRKIPLTFVRMKTREEAILGRQPAELVRYENALRGYLAHEGCDLIDEASDPRIRIEYFGIGDHLNRSFGRPLFTSLFAAFIIEERSKSKTKA